MSPRRVRLLIWKELLQLRRDPILLRVLFLMPIMQLVVFGYVVSADVTNLRTAIVDLDRTPVSRQIASAFTASDYFDVVRRPAGESEIKPLMDSGEIGVAVVITEGTAARLTRGENASVGVVVDGSDSSVASVGSGNAARIVALVNDRRAAEAGLGDAGGAPSLDSRIRVVFNPELVTVNGMIPGLVATILMISLMVIMSQAVVRERERGTLGQMFVTPISRAEYLLGKLVPYAALATAQMAVVAVVGLGWFRVPFRGSPLVALTGLGLFLLTCLGMGLLVSLVSHTRYQAQQTVMFVMLPAMILSGFIFPIESMPDWLQPISYLIPLRYALEVIRASTIKGVGFEHLGSSFLGLGVFAVVVLGGALIATRRRLAD